MIKAVQTQGKANDFRERSICSYWTDHVSYSDNHAHKLQIWSYNGSKANLMSGP
jgi:hypothetical protein